MALVVAAVLVALIGARPLIRRAVPWESPVAFGLMLVAVLLLFETDRLG